MSPESLEEFKKRDFYIEEPDTEILDDEMEEEEDIINDVDVEPMELDTDPIPETNNHQDQSNEHLKTEPDINGDDTVQPSPNIPSTKPKA